MATKLQNLERIEAIAKAVGGTVKMDREAGTGQWTVSVEWSSDGVNARAWGRDKTLELALADAVAKVGTLGL